MKKQPGQHPDSHRASFAALLKGVLVAGVACIPACGPGDKATGTSDAKGGGPASKPATVVVVEPKAINLRKLALFEGGELLGRSPANVTYKVKGDVKGVFEFHKKQFLALAWKETPDTSVTDQSASGTFTGAGYNISATVYSVGTPGEVNVMLHNHGNIDLAKLPLPPGTKPVYVGPLNAMHVTEAPVAETAEATRKLLMDAGWEPHGSAGDSSYFKQGTNRITVTISSAPAQGGKTMISYGSELMAGDLPAPPDAQDVRYVDTQQTLTFETTGDKDAVVAFYKEKLAKTGWKPNEEKTLRIDDYDLMVFRTPGGDVIFLKIMPDHDGKRPVSLGYLSAEESAELDQKSKENIKKRQEKAAAK